LKLLDERPELVIVQNPSLVLTFFMVTLGKLLTNAVIVDAHNIGLKPFSTNYNWLLPLYRTIQRRSDLTIVTNQRLAQEVTKNGGRSFVLEDRIPKFENLTGEKLRGNYNITSICTYDIDEPYHLVIDTAKLLDSSICIYMTGRYEKIPTKIRRKAPSNIIFTGYLSDRDYKNLLFSSDAIMDLTLLNDCLVCGAYEALAVQKPMILSDTTTLREYFSKGVVYTENRPEAIASAIESALENRDELRKQVIDLKLTLGKEWLHKLQRLIDILEDLSVPKRTKTKCPAYLTSWGNRD
jgi:glycosyltransferase involved in cell wall biosynthesis